ncbi:MAG: hypothetical protein WDN00_12480 [Limisphaerales bacterium]
MKTVSVFPDFIRRTVITADDTISEYSVTQGIDGKLEIALEVPRATKNSAEQAIRTGFTSLL